MVDACRTPPLTDRLGHARLTLVLPGGCDHIVALVSPHRTGNRVAYGFDRASQRVCIQVGLAVRSRGLRVA